MQEVDGGEENLQKKVFQFPELDEFKAYVVLVRLLGIERLVEYDEAQRVVRLSPYSFEGGIIRSMSVFDLDERLKLAFSINAWSLVAGCPLTIDSTVNDSSRNNVLQCVHCGAHIYRDHQQVKKDGTPTQWLIKTPQDHKPDCLWKAAGGSIDTAVEQKMCLLAQGNQSIEPHNTDNCGIFRKDFERSLMVTIKALADSDFCKNFFGLPAVSPREKFVDVSRVIFGLELVSETMKPWESSLGTSSREEGTSLVPPFPWQQQGPDILVSLLDTLYQQSNDCLGVVRDYMLAEYDHIAKKKIAIKQGKAQKAVEKARQKRAEEQQHGTGKKKAKRARRSEHDGGLLATTTTTTTVKEGNRRATVRGNMATAAVVQDEPRTTAGASLQDAPNRQQRAQQIELEKKKAELEQIEAETKKIEAEMKKIEKEIQDMQQSLLEAKSQRDKALREAEDALREAEEARNALVHAEDALREAEEARNALVHEQGKIAAAGTKVKGCIEPQASLIAPSTTKNRSFAQAAATPERNNHSAGSDGQEVVFPSSTLMPDVAIGNNATKPAVPEGNVVATLVVGTDRVCEPVGWSERTVHAAAGSPNRTSACEIDGKLASVGEILSKKRHKNDDIRIAARDIVSGAVRELESILDLPQSAPKKNNSSSGFDPDEGSGRTILGKRRRKPPRKANADTAGEKQVSSVQLFGVSTLHDKAVASSSSRGNERKEFCSVDS